MNSKIYSATPIGIEAKLVEVEISLSAGKEHFSIVGLPDITIRESAKRIKTALKNSDVNLQRQSIHVNLAPASLKKEGALFDMAIAIAILQAHGFITLTKRFVEETLFVGELSFYGAINPIKGALVIANYAHQLSKKRIILPTANAHEAALTPNIEVIGIENLVELIEYLQKIKDIAPTKTNISDYSAEIISDIDFKEVKGQYAAKRALQIAAAGRHNILFSGPPGSGKTMLAHRLMTIMPPMSFKEIVETTKIYSVSDNLNNRSIINRRPFRAPHHSSSLPALTGGGATGKPGELSLAHNGILFLDELLEFKRDALESLRQPLEAKHISISRVNYNISYPCNFILVAALNPCPCGYFGDKNTRCSCTKQMIERYKEKLSGPLADRIDIKVNVEAVTYQESQEVVTKDSLSTQTLKIGVDNALRMQFDRFKDHDRYNSQMNTAEIEKFCIVTDEAAQVLKDAFSRMNMSMRTYHKILKVARTIADIDNVELIDVNHIKQAVIFKS